MIQTYINNNYSVTMLGDGSKIRKIPNGVIAKPYFPESIDLKITNHCTASCQWCHEDSNPGGKHADINWLINSLEGLPSGVEIAIGGGNPLDYPKLLKLLIAMKEKGLIANITVNQKHLVSHSQILNKILTKKLINGLGVSYIGDTTDYRSKTYDKLINLVKTYPHTVIHFIPGVHSVSDFKQFVKDCKEVSPEKIKVLLLGYKTLRRGVFYKSCTYRDGNVDTKLHRWALDIPLLIKETDIVKYSFDNLAIKQLQLKRLFNNEAWSRFYMGDDGIFTFYVDGVNRRFAKSSTIEEPLLASVTDNIISMFKKIANVKN